MTPAAPHLRPAFAISRTLTENVQFGAEKAISNEELGCRPRFNAEYVESHFAIDDLLWKVRRKIDLDGSWDLSSIRQDHELSAFHCFLHHHAQNGCRLSGVALQFARIQGPNSACLEAYAQNELSKADATGRS